MNPLRNHSDVESHGSNPWTRYCITFDEARSSGVHPDAIKFTTSKEHAA